MLLTLTLAGALGAAHQLDAVKRAGRGQSGWGGGDVGGGHTANSGATCVMGRVTNAGVLCGQQGSILLVADCAVSVRR